MNGQAAVSEFDVLEWIGKLTETAAREHARERLREAGEQALPWLVCAYNGNRERNGEIAALVRDIVGRCGVPRKGGRAIKRIIENMA
ncbi:Uncharacterised protein [uncultured archaeon]|nr:Uncharacterised protein [uncultured archaeon]